MAVFHIASQTHAQDLERLQKARRVAVSLKINGAEEDKPFRSKPVLIQLCSDEDVFLVEPAKVDPSQVLKALLETDKVTKVFRKAKTPVKHFLHHYGLQTRGIFCCHLAVKLLAMGNRGERQRLQRELQPLRDQQRAFEQTAFDPTQRVDPDRLQWLADEGTMYLNLHEYLSGGLAQHKLKRVSSLEFRTVLPVAAMELRGVYADPGMLAEAKIQFEAEMDAMQSALLKELRTSDTLEGMNLLNLNSPDQVKKALHERGVMVQDTAESRLRPYVEDYPFVGQLLQYRHLSRLHGSIASQLEQFIAPETGRIHATYHQIASPSGRFACTDPNIQQIPREKRVRGCIRPQNGYRFIVADYSQVELRVAAGVSKDKLMLKAYGEGGDLHRLTAGLTMGKPVAEVAKDERQAAKAINFGLIYAMGPRGLQQSAKSSYGVAMSLDQAKTFRQRFFDNYRGIHQWQKNTEAFGRKHGYVRTAAGRIRSYKDEPLRVTELLNIPIQGTAAEGLKSALCIFWDRIQDASVDADVVAIIHDEIIVEVKEDQVDRAKKILETAMIDGLRWLVPGVPFKVDMAIAESWAEK